MYFITVMGCLEIIHLEIYVHFKSHCIDTDMSGSLLCICWRH